MAELKEQAKEFKEKRDLTNEEVRDLTKKNRDRIGLLKDVTAQAQEEKRLRDKENEEVRKLKTGRDAAEEEARSSRQELSEKQARLKEFGGEGSLPLHVLERRLEELEWIQETEATTARKERELSKQIRELRKQMPQSKEAKALFNEVKALKEKLKALNSRAKELREKMQERARESEAHHENRLKLLRKAEHLQEKISATIELLGEKRGEADELHKEFVDARKEIREAEKRDRDEEKEEKRKREKEIRGKLDEQAKRILERFKAGEKLSMEELMILRETGAL